MNERIAKVRLGSRRASDSAEEALGPWSGKIDRDDYSSDCSDDATDQAYLAAVDDLSYSEPYRDDIDYDARHPGPFCSRKESGAKCKAEDSKYDDDYRESEGSGGHPGENRAASEEGENTSGRGNDCYYRDSERSLGV
jgi:hypothetical protein